MSLSSLSAIAWARRWRAATALLLVLLGGLPSPRALAAADSADNRRLTALHATLAPRLAQSVFQRPLIIESTEQGDIARGEVFALLPHRFADVAQALQRPAQWCQVLELHLNVKRCATGPGAVTMHLGSKRDTPLECAHPLAMAFTLEAQEPDLLKVALRARATTRSCWKRCPPAPTAPSCISATRSARPRWRAGPCRAT